MATDGRRGRQPRLPPEILEQVVFHLALPCTYGDPSAASALASCSLVSRTMRRWALDARYGVVVTPRHVRDFRRWCKKAQGEMKGHSRALFVALDDVSKEGEARNGSALNIQCLAGVEVDQHVGWLGCGVASAPATTRASYHPSLALDVGNPGCVAGSGTDSRTANANERIPAR